METAKNNRTCEGKCFWKVKIVSEAHLESWIKDYFGGLDIKHRKDGSSVITGKLNDMPALYGLFLCLRDAGIVLHSLEAEKVGCSRH